MKNKLLFNFLLPFATGNTEKKEKRFRQLLVLVVLVMLFGVNGVMGQTIMSWDFSTNNNPNTNLPGGSATVSFNTGGTIGTNGCAGNGISINGWNVGEYFQIVAPTTGYNLTTLSLNGRSSNTGPWKFKFQYSSTGTGGTFSDLGTTFQSTNSNSCGSYSADFSSINALDNNANTVIRIVFTGGEADGNPATGDAAGGGAFRIDDVIISGTAAATPSIAISNGTIAAGTPNNGQTNVVLQRYDMAVTTADATLTGLTVTTAGTYVAADLSNLKCWYQTSTTFNSGTATLLSTKSTSLGSGSQVFPSFTSQAITSGNTGYIFVTADIASGATNGNTINIASNAFSNISFSSGTKTGTDPVAAGGVQTITVAVPDIALSSPAASAANITVGTTNNVIYRFDLAITTATPSLTGVTINTSTGSNVSGDLTNLKCWHQTSTTFNSGTATLLSTKTTSLAAGSQVFPTFSSQSLTTGSTHYIFITADVPLTATPNNTIIVSAITTSDLTFATGNKTGTASASGTKTIIDCTPADVTSAAASSASSSSVLTWVNPVCYDEILIVAALASNTGTPTGNGSAYTGNLAYGSGTALGNGFVVYKGSTSSQTVTGLTDGTQYFFKYFTRRGNTWTSGTEVDATPNVAGYYWNGASIAANPAAGGTGTWGTANSWRQPSSSGAQATWADGNNAIFAGTAGTVSLDATRVGTAFYINTNGYIFANSATQTLTGPIILGNNVGCTFSPNVNIVTPVSGTLNIGSISGSGSANITISSAQGPSTTIAQRINIATASSSISVPINIVSAGGTGTGTVAGIVATSTATSLTSSATITNNSAIKTIVGATSGNDITANGVISGSADLMFAGGASGGAGTITLGAANSYTGATIFNAANSGVIRLGITNALPTGTNVTMANSSGNGGIFDLNGFNQTIGSLTSGIGGGSIRNNGASDATLTISGSTSPAAYRLVIADGTSTTALTRAGTGTTELTAANTYTGLTTVSGGTLRLNKSGGTTIPITNNVTVDGGTFQVSTNQTLNNLNLTSGTVIIDAGVTLTINGTITRTSGVIQGTATSNLVITGASGTIAFDQTTPGTTNVLKNLTITGSGTTTLGNALNITAGSSSGVVTVGTGATLTTGGFLTFKSDANGTAQVAEIGSGGSITGNVTVERYLPARRAWRLLTAPVKGNTNNSINVNWQGTNNEGVLLWHPSGNGTNGLSVGPQANIFNYTNGWQAISNTTTSPLFTQNDNNAFLVFPTGPHGSTTITGNTTPIATTLKPKGELITGSVTKNLTAYQLYLIGNPYASPINTETLVQPNSGNKVWLLDPSLGSFGGYVAFDGINWSVLPTGNDKNIQSGQAFFVANSATTTFTISESHKVSGNSNTWFGKTANTENTENTDKIRVLLYKQDNANWRLADGILTVSSAIGNDAVDATDTNKMTNFNENILFRNGTSNLAIEYRGLPLAGTVQPMRLTGTTVQPYQLRVYTENYSNSDLQPYIEDTQTGTLTAIPIDGSIVTLPFTGQVANSATPDTRFRISYQAALSNNNPSAIFSAIYPNPVQEGWFTIDLKNNMALATYSLINLLGQEVQTGELTAQQNLIRVKPLEQGVYVLQITQEGKTETTKLIIK